MVSLRVYPSSAYILFKTILLKLLSPGTKRFCWRCCWSRCF